MKKLKYIILSTIALGLFSCGDDDYSIAYVDNEAKTPLVGSIILTRNAAAPTTKMMEATVTIPQTFDVESTVEVTTESKFGNLLETQTFIEKSYITVPAGSTTGTGLIRTAGDEDAVLDDYFGVPDFAAAFISGIALTQPPREDEDGNKITPYVPLDDPYTMTSDSSVSITGLAYDSSMDPDDEILAISLDWEGPWADNDFDLYIFSNAFSLSAESGSRFEGISFNDPDDDIIPTDGDYTVEVAIFTSVDDVTPVPYRLVLTHPNGDTDVYEGLVDPAVGFIDPVNVTKSTDEDGVVTFVTSAI